jgi:hypothetical protein
VDQSTAVHGLNFAHQTLDLLTVHTTPFSENRKLKPFLIVWRLPW